MYGMNWSVKNIQGSSAQDIAGSIESSLRSGALQVGDALPAVRHLATQLGVNPNTVAAAYARLRDAGRLITSGRRGTRVAGETVPIPTAYYVPEGLRDLASGHVDNSLLPRLRASGWSRVQADPVSKAANQGEDDADLLALSREWLAAQGLPGDDASIGVFSGALDAIERALRQHARPGDRVAIEDPCWPPLLALLRSMRLRPVPLAMDEQGVQVPEAGVLAGCAAVVLTPRAHNPTGLPLRADRWRALRRQLRACPNTLVIFNDYWGLLSSTPLVINKALPPHWLYVMSLSKCLGPDMRVCITAGTEELVAGMRAHHALGPRWVSRWLQRLAAQLWKQAAKGKGRGSFIHSQNTYAARRSALVTALQKKGLPIDDTAHEGLHLWLPVPDELIIVQAMASRGWAVQAGSALRLNCEPAIRVSLGDVQTRDIKRLAGDLVQALNLPVRAVF